jgi:protein-arginine kinase activator protein McsA
MLSHILISKRDLIVQMKIPSFRIKNNNDNNSKAKTDNKLFVCKECKMTFQSKDSLELHKRKSRHFTGFVYFGKDDK